MFFKSPIYLNYSLSDKVSSSWALSDYSRPAFSPLRIKALYFCCDLDVGPRVWSQAAGWLWNTSGVLLEDDTLALVLGTACLGQWASV